jgi:hypothetical protein
VGCIGSRCLGGERLCLGNLGLRTCLGRSSIMVLTLNQVDTHMAMNYRNYIQTNNYNYWSNLIIVDMYLHFSIQKICLYQSDGFWAFGIETWFSLLRIFRS